MSKSKGNVMDPLNLLEKYSADALRFTLCAMLHKEQILNYQKKEF